MTVLERLGAHAVGGYRHGLPGPVREAARLHLADTVGAWINGAATAEGRALLRFESPDREGVLARVALNCALARLSEVDDIHLPSATTPGALVVPAALTVGGSLGSSGAAVAEAIAAGYDLMTRLGAALKGPWILYRGVWPTYLTAPLAVAAVAARLLGLTEQQAAHALGIAIGMSSPSVGRQSGTTLSRWLAIGQAARNGALAAYAAESGFTADLRLFETEFFQAAYGLSLDSALLLDALRERPALPETSLKPWCAARQTMAASQAVKELIESGVAAPDASKIAVWVPALQLKMVDHGTHFGDRGSYLTSLPHQVAIAALGPDAGTEEIGRFVPKVSVAADDTLLQHYPKAWPARVLVTTSSGGREKLALHVPGDPERPFDELQVAAKFWRFAAPLAGEHAAESALRLAFAALDAEDGPKTLLEAVERTAAAHAENA